MEMTECVYLLMRTDWLMIMVDYYFSNSMTGTKRLKKSISILKKSMYLISLVLDPTISTVLSSSDYSLIYHSLRNNHIWKRFMIKQGKRTRLKYSYKLFKKSYKMQWMKLIRWDQLIRVYMTRWFKIMNTKKCMWTNWTQCWKSQIVNSLAIWK